MNLFLVKSVEMTLPITINHYTVAKLYQKQSRLNINSVKGFSKILSFWAPPSGRAVATRSLLRSAAQRSSNRSLHPWCGRTKQLVIENRDFPGLSLSGEVCQNDFANYYKPLYGREALPHDQATLNQ